MDTLSVSLLVFTEKKKMANNWFGEHQAKKQTDAI